MYNMYNKAKKLIYIHTFDSPLSSVNLSKSSNLCGLGLFNTYKVIEIY